MLFATSASIPGFDSCRGLMGSSWDGSCNSYQAGFDPHERALNSWSDISDLLKRSHMCPVAKLVTASDCYFAVRTAVNRASEGREFEPLRGRFLVDLNNFYCYQRRDAKGVKICAQTTRRVGSAYKRL